MKNYYILLPIIPEYAESIEAFISGNSSKLLNSGGNTSLETINHPVDADCVCYRFELSEAMHDELIGELIALGADVCESAEAYIMKFPEPFVEDINI